MVHALRLPGSIYSRTMLLVGGVTFLLQLTTFFIIFNQMVLPNVRIQVDEFVDQLLLASESPQGLDDHTLFQSAPPDLQLHTTIWRIPFWHYVEEALTQRIGVEVSVQQEQGAQLGDGLYWVELPDPQGGLQRIGFSPDREGCLNPPVLLMVLLLVVSVSVISVYFLSRWLVRPIDELRLAVGELGLGEYPKPLPEKGPAEFSALVHLFNWMVGRVRSLTENRSTLLAGISHDLKTPLARMRLSVEMLSAEESRDLVEGMVEDLDLMDGMISQALEFARGERPGALQQTELNELLSVLVERKQRDQRAIRWQPLPNPCLCRVDPQALQRILSNYLDNAAHYGGSEPVELRLQCGTERVVIEVLDRGEGIPEGEQEKVFRPFYRLDRSRSHQGGGNGLGLAIVLNLATSCGWEVALDNRSGGGCVASLVILKSVSSAPG